MTKVNLSKKTLDDIRMNENNCINCKKCYNSCPMMNKYSSSPKELMEKIKEYYPNLDFYNFVEPRYKVKLEENR